MNNWHVLAIIDGLQRLKSNVANGLDEAEVMRRLKEIGPNALVERGRKNPWHILWEQLTTTMVVILIVAAILSALPGDYKDVMVILTILTIVALNAALGFTQEYRAECALAALEKLAVPIVRVRRSGHIQEVSARNLVSGDIVLLEAGNIVPPERAPGA